MHHARDTQAAIAALTGGGFIVFYDDDEAGRQPVRGQRYDASGNAVGSTFVVGAGNGTQFDALLLDDGRVIVTWREGEFRSTIVDVRDDPNTNLGDSEVQTGTIGDDTFTALLSADTVNGWGGDDVISDFAATNNFERIDLGSVSAITSLSDLLTSHTTQQDGVVLIDTGGGNSITLTGVNIGDLDANDFIF